ncbi:NADH-quinone oxidoreductase subunit M [Nostoc cf. edaphicum LEGE 07299]|uniref:NADH-quinone oxidoreductase subunit M n=1 Tax=Nostoc cf. edaphicum LEGE 07299 TaxID=2777974 RepID=A0ABR9TUZ9_9NOSO|nr:NADH-quinone oxidoreductase subunit M [Nostoc edaphicum]MBE9104193.1 NADH-quinone oxidoreductase subunit M [Nostoc cf. edaphicum LEGE 07299]
MLSALIWIPAIAAAIISFFPGVTPRIARWTAFTTTVGMLILSLVLVSKFELLNSNWQFQEYFPWIEHLGFTYHLGVDGLSLPLIVLNGLLGAIAIYSTDQLNHRPRFYYALILLLNAGVTGAFLAQDLLLFFLFYELELIPLYLLIAIWGGQRREYAAMKFLIYTAVSGILVLIGFLGLVGLSGATSFTYDTALSSVLPLTTQILLLSTILLGFAIKTPLVPFHTWLPDAHVEASTPISVLLAGVLLKLGTYGLVRFGLGLFPEAWSVLAPWLATWAVVSVLYGVFAAITQKDMKKMVAYSSIGHMGYVLLGAAAGTAVSLTGAIFQMVSHGLISALLFLLVGVVYSKTGTRDLNKLKGLLNPEQGLPVIGSLMILAVMASAGIPSMAGFVAEFLCFRGSFMVYPVQTVLCMLATGLTAVYFLILLDNAFFGRIQEDIAPESVKWSERIPGIILAVIIIFLGVQPGFLTGKSDATTTAMLAPLPTISQRF